MTLRHALAPLVLLLAACTHGNGGPRVTVEPPVSAADDRVHVEVSGLAPREVATVRLRSTDANGVRWRSSARFRADDDGEIDLDRARPVSGDYGYRGAYGMGLIWSLRGHRPNFGYVWPDAAPAKSVFVPKPVSFHVSVHANGKQVASTRLRRKGSLRGFRVQRLTLRQNGVVGSFFSPLQRTRRPSILLLGGLEGGALGPIAPLLAGRGHAVLALEYWGKPGLPPHPAKIPLEYFARALKWLGRQPQVDRNRIVVLGHGKGSGAALLLGVHYPKLLHAVVAANPHSTASCSDTLCSHGPPWTLHGRALPHTAELTATRPRDDPAAVIPVERIPAPIFLVCGNRGAAWTSPGGHSTCRSAEAIMRRLRVRGHRYADVSHAYLRASDGVGLLVPYFWRIFGNRYDDESDERARAHVWPRLLEFLARLENG